MADKLFTEKLSLPLVSFIVIGMMLGGGIFVYTGIVFGMTGSALPIAFLLAAVPVFLSMLPLAMLGSAFPVSGANYMYPSRMVSPILAFSAIWVYALASFFGQIPLYVIATGKYLESIFPETPVILVAILILTVFYIINLLGIKFAAQIQGVLLLLLISGLLCFSFGSIPSINIDNLSLEKDITGGSLLLGTSLLTFTYFGANGIIELGSEIKNPGKTIPRAFYIAFPIVTVLYFGVSAGLVGTLPKEMIIGESDPLIVAASNNLRHGLFVFFVLGGAVLALLTTLNALFLIGTRSLLMIVKDGILPKWMGKISPKRKVPWVLLTIIWMLSILGVISGFSLEEFASYAALGGLVIFLPILMAARVFPKKYPHYYLKSTFKLSKLILNLCVGVGVIMVIFFGLVILVDMDSILKTGIFILFVVSGGVLYFLRKKYLRKRNRNFDFRPLGFEDM
jgi:APA family basic amino acid/polyamine antiporter